MKEEYVALAKEVVVLIDKQLAIQSDNRAEDNRPEDFMDTLRSKRDEKISTRFDERLKYSAENRNRLDEHEDKIKDKIKEFEALRRVIRAAPEEQRKKLEPAMQKIDVGLARIRWELLDCQKQMRDAAVTSDEERAAITTELALEFRKGNCDEMSSIAYFIFKQKNYRPIELLLSKAKSDGDSHQFLVIGRAKNDNLSDPSSWAADAVVCDPWLREVFPPKDLPAKLSAAGYPASVQSIVVREEAI